MKILKIVISILALLSINLAFAEVLEINLWEGVKMPGKQTAPADRPRGKKFASNEGFNAVATPAMRFYKSDSAKPAPTIIICPGGAYKYVTMGYEGNTIAEFLNKAGMNCFVLKYRIPDSRESALQDAQRAIRLIRANAKEWNVDPKRVGILGFSAGGHLSANLSTNFDKNSYEPLDKADKLSSRPDFTVLIYPAYLADKNTLELAPEIRVRNGVPPAFLVQTLDDNHYEASSVGYFLAMRKAKVSVDLHMFAKGGHGYGLSYAQNKPVGEWGEILKSWLKFNKFLDN